MAGTPSYIVMPPDSTGKSVQCWENTINSQNVLTEAVTITDSTGTEKATPSNPLTVAGTAAGGSAVSGNPVLVGGSDGTDARTLSTDTSGRPTVVGAAANGAAVAGNPVLVGGSDGTDARTIATDSSGHPQIQPIGNGSVINGQAAVTASAANLGSNACRAVTIKASVNNTINIYVGSSSVSTSNGFELASGDSITLPVTNTNLVYVIASTTGAVAPWIATN